jgi:rod shape-determining protein MreB
MLKLPWARNIGIDLGTTNTLVYVEGKGVVLNEPTIVAIDTVSRKIVAIGAEAKEMLGRTPGTISIMRPMQDGAIADFGITFAMLRYFLTKALGKSAWAKPRVLVSVPAGITSTERRAVLEATTKAGARRAILVKEPILAALGAGVKINEPRGSMIVDIGGGTTDVAVISLGGVVASTSVKCAGNKLDQAIAEYIRRAYDIAIGDATAEEVKKTIVAALPKTDSENKKETMEVKGRNTVSGLPETVTLTTNDLLKAIDYELKEIIKAIKDVLEETPPELASDIIDRGITLTGGSSLLALLPELVEEHTGVSVRLADEPLLCVAKGTGLLLSHMQDYERSILARQ